MVVLRTSATGRCPRGEQSMKRRPVVLAQQERVAVGGRSFDVAGRVLVAGRQLPRPHLPAAAVDPVHDGHQAGAAASARIVDADAPHAGDSRIDERVVAADVAVTRIQPHRLGPIG